MDNLICKQGILKKEGKKKLQGKRKRWFDLNGQTIKYYEPDSPNTNDGLLGTIDICEITSVVYSKSTKNGFDIKTKTRTYYLEAKTDADRDDWMNCIEKACLQQGIPINQGNDSPNMTSESSGKSKLKFGKKKKSRTSSFYSEDIDDVNITPPLRTQPSLSHVDENTGDSETSGVVEKPNVTKTEAYEPEKVKNQSNEEKTGIDQSAIEIKANDQSLSEMQREFYTKLNTQLDDVTSDDDDDEETNDAGMSDSDQIENDGNSIEQYEAFSKLKQLFKDSSYQEKSLDIESLSSKYRVSPTSEYIHISILKAIMNASAG